MKRIFPILLLIGLAWGQNTISFSSNDDKDSDKLVKSFGRIWENIIL